MVKKSVGDGKQPNDRVSTDGNPGIINGVNETSTNYDIPRVTNDADIVSWLREEALGLEPHILSGSWDGTLEVGMNFELTLGVDCDAEMFS